MFTTPVDIAKRTCQHLGVPIISTLGDNARAAVEINSCFDKIRQAELIAHVWRFATRVVPLRPLTTTTRLITFPAFNPATTYQQGDIANDTTANAGNSGTTLYLSLTGSNVGNTPSSSPASWAPYFGPDYTDTWSSSANYYAGEIAYYASGAGSKLYLSTTQAANLNQTPTSGAPWTVAALTGASTAILYIPYPIGMVNAGGSRSIYRLPFGYMRVAPQDAKAPGVAHQTVSAGMMWSDIRFEGNYFTTSSPSLAGVTSGPLMFRCGVDIPDVTQMPAVFCELFAARMAYSLVESLTNNKQLKTDIAQIYDNFLMRAWKDDMLEQGATDPDEMGFLTSRIPESTQPPAAPARG